MKKARVLLAAPNLLVNEGELSRIEPPMGLLLFAPLLKQDGHEVLIKDFALDGWNTLTPFDIKNKRYIKGATEEYIAKVISDFNPDILGISVLYSSLIDSAKDVARIAKKINPKITVIVGGNCISNSVVDYKFYLSDPKNSGLPDYITHFEGEDFDYAMTGEAEYPFKDFVNGIINKKDISNIPGLIRKIGHKKYKINPAKILHDLNLLPRPAREMVDMEAYFDIGHFHSSKSRSKRVLSVMCSRGCPEKCTFCTTPEVYGQITRWRSIEHIMDEINTHVREFNIGEIQFNDDTITVNKKNLYALCKELEKVGLPWCTPNGTKVNYHQKEQFEMYKAMHDSGAYQITLACESGVQRVLDEIVNKRLPVETIMPAIERAKKAGLLVHTFWILGFPGETREEMQKTIDFALQCGADSFSFSVLAALPGTPIYRQVCKENLWWDGRESFNSLRASLLKVDGFDTPQEFEKFVYDANIKANLVLKEKNPERFIYKYGKNATEKSLMKQT